jgi:hypothetical protein
MWDLVKCHTLFKCVGEPWRASKNIKGGECLFILPLSLNLCLLHINKEVFIPFGSSLLKRLLEIQVGNMKNTRFEIASTLVERNV